MVSAQLTVVTQAAGVRSNCCVFFKVQGGRVNTVADTRRLGSVVKHMAQVSTTLATHSLNTPLALRRVRHQFHTVTLGDIRERRPSGLGVELGVGVKERVPTYYTVV